jgi:hypothetical protein|tara:strand:+ start:428 stop:670 length:243 start_codon:yes stop_codon:yes gene_type:complete
MKWVYSLIEDDRGNEFKLAYEVALRKKLLIFKFDNMDIDIIKAGAAIKIINDYNKNLEVQADYAEAERIYWIEVENKLNS